jgi:competence protein ComEC
MPRAGWLAVGAIVGALIGGQLQQPAPLMLAAAGALLFAALGAVTRRARLAAAGVACALVLARALAGGMAAPASGADVRAALEGGATEEHAARVLSIGSTDGGMQRAVLELQPPDGPERVYAWLPRYPSLAPTDRIRFTGRLEPAPDAQGFGEYLARNAIPLISRTRGLTRLDGEDTPIAALEHVRRAAGDALARALPQPQAGLGAAMLIGLRDLVARDVATDFRLAGLSHVVAISGWHLSLIAALVSAALASLGRRSRSLLVVAFICAYAVLAGGSPSVIRAAIMASVVLLARETGRRGQAAAALGLAVTGMLIVEPATVEQPGFQLSVAATAGLLRWAGPIKTRVARRLPSATPNWLAEALAVSLAAQLATLPLVLLHFGRLSLVAPLSNLLVAPIIAPAMIAAAVALAAGGLIVAGVPALVLAPISLLGSLSLGAMASVADAAAGLPFASVELQPPLNFASALAACALVGWAAMRRSTPDPAQPASHEGRRPNARRWPAGRVPHVIAGGCALALVGVLLIGARPDQRLHLSVLDVGQGDAILVQGPAGGRMLVDTGPDPDRLLAVLDGRLPAWDRRLDLVVITHPHEDHVAGLALLLDRYRIGAVAEPGMIGPGPGDAAFRRRMTELGRESRIIAAGDHLNLDGVRIDVLWPLPGRVPLRPSDTGKQINNVSLVLDMRFGARRMLLTGDAEQEIDPQLLAAGLGADVARPLDVLKVAHHGSATATTDALLETLAPRVAVISAGWGNPYGHPSAATVARLEASGARLFRTDLDGTVDISTDGRDLTALAAGGRPKPARPTSQLPPGIGFCPIPTARGRSARRRRDGASYNRRHGNPPSLPGGGDTARPRSARLAGAPHRRRGRGGRLPCRPDPAQRHCH